MRFEIRNIDNFLSSHTLGSLPESVEMRIAAKKNEQALRQSLSAYCLLLEILASEYGMVNPDIRFTPSGKPYIPEGPFISLSHSEKMVAVAVADSAVGVDIEKIRDFNPAVAEKYFTDSERELLNTDNPNINFYKLWTAKEAFLKMQGTGLKKLSDTELIVCGDSFRFENATLQTEIRENYVISICFSEKTDF